MLGILPLRRYPERVGKITFLLSEKSPNYFTKIKHTGLPDQNLQYPLQSENVK